MSDPSKNQTKSISNNTAVPFLVLTNCPSCRRWISPPSPNLHRPCPPFPIGLLSGSFPIRLARLQCLIFTALFFHLTPSSPLQTRKNLSLSLSLSLSLLLLSHSESVITESFLHLSNPIQSILAALLPHLLPRSVLFFVPFTRHFLLKLIS
ncbi:hypothetical protein RIF29_17498 [Crotalaria pallida]|uniref:Uncharacterized protein n=1 Tax=Crotalaria pallida TaxID=3830 RepID=A0AAN9FHE9_CROPI